MMVFGDVAFAIGMICWGLLNLITRDFAAPWQAVPAGTPGRTVLACACGVLMLAAGVGLLIKRTATVSARVLLVYLVLWLLLLKTPALFTAPKAEVVWLGWSEIAVMVAGALSLAASDETSRRVARYLFGAALIPIGLSHFFYARETASMVPAWLPFHPALVSFTGSAHIAAGLAVLFGVYPRLAATLEAMMITAFTVLVWVPPHQWTAVVVSLAIGNGAWAVASRLSDPARPTVGPVGAAPPPRDGRRSPAALG
jgi:uncharacterized membrane protein